MTAFLTFLNYGTWVVGYTYTIQALFRLAKKKNMKVAWMAFIPLLNFYLMIKVVKRPGWWIYLMLIPMVNTVILIKIWLEFEKLRKKELPEYEDVIKNFLGK